METYEGALEAGGCPDTMRSRFGHQALGHRFSEGGGDGEGVPAPVGLPGGITDRNSRNWLELLQVG